MDFLKKIKNFLFRRSKKESFSEQVKNEKRKKYILPKDSESYVPQRKKKKFSIASSYSKTPIQKGIITLFFRDLSGGSQRNLYHIMGGIGMLLLVLSSYIIIFSPYFKISPTHVLIEPMPGSQGVNISIAFNSIEYIYGKSIFLIDEKNIEQSIKKNLKHIAKVKVDRLFPNGIKILVTSLPVPYETSIFEVENKTFGLSENGILIPSADLKNADMQQRIKIVSPDLRSEIFLNYKNVIPAYSLHLISKIIEAFSAKWSDITITKALYFARENEVHIITESNVKIIFSLQDNGIQKSLNFPNFLIGQLTTLNTFLLTHRNKIIEGNLVYVDARIPGKIFICEPQDICQQNLINIYGNVYQE